MVSNMILTVLVKGFDYLINIRLHPLLCVFVILTLSSFSQVNSGEVVDALLGFKINLCRQVHNGSNYSV